jgi:hypothetical protein
MLGIFGAYLAWRMMRLLLRLVLLIAGVAAVVLLVSHGRVTVARLGESGFWRSQATALQRDVQRAIERGFSPNSPIDMNRR